MADWLLQRQDLAAAIPQGLEVQPVLTPGSLVIDWFPIEVGEFAGVDVWAHFACQGS